MAALISNAVATALSPVATGPLLWLLTMGPEKVRNGLQLKLAMTYGEEKVKKFLLALKAIFALGVALKVNTRLNQFALNNWEWKSQKSKWVWNWEIAVVTGGSNGIGAEITRNLMRKGVKVAVLDVVPLHKSLENYSNIKFFKCNVTDPSSIQEAARQVRETFGEPTILINNAGIGAPHTILESTDAYVQRIFAINIMSHFTLVREFLPHMIKKNKGHIVGLASMASYVSSPGLVDYASTKAAVMAFHEGLNQEIRHIYKTPGVLNTVVHPYWVKTNLVAGYENHLEKTQGKLMTPEYIAKKITNQIFSCNGGQVIMPARMRPAGLLRGLPNWITEIARDVSVGGSAASFPKGATGNT